MRHELFIDNKKVDLSPSTNINLTYKSNLLSELDKITSSYSYTIKLPKTKRNMELIEGCNIPSNDSSFAYLQHRARLLRDGIEIVRDAVVVLLSVGDDIQISLTWGNVSALATFLTSDAMLIDLEFNPISWTVMGTEETPRGTYGNNWKFFQPVVKVSETVEKISSSKNLNISLPENTLYPKLVMPILNMPQAGENTEDLTLSGGSQYNDGLNMVVLYDTSNLQSSRFFRFDVPVDGKHSFFYARKPNIKFSLKGQVRASYILRYGSDSNVRLTDNAGQIDMEPSSIEYLPSEDRPYSKVFVFDIDQEFNGEDFLNTPFKLKVSGIEINNGTINVSSGLQLHGELTTSVEIPSVGNPVEFDITSNMPDISQIDFLKGIMAIMGWYAEPMESGSGIRMLSYSAITDNKGKAVDWSDKIVNRRIEPSGIEFRMDDMAQKNYFRYAEDDTVTGDYDSYITVDDKTLDAWKDVVTLPFAATDTVDGLPSIPLYSFNEEGEMEINSSLVPRILIQEGTTLKFDGLQWNKLIQANWQAYQDIIRRPKIITEQIRLNAIDLKLIDMTIPVYISQYGSYFAILEIKTKNDDICDVQLLKI